MTSPEFNLDPPSQLIFQESSDKLFQQLFKISNPSKEPLAFKIKTTSPKHYCVRPNVGLIGPSGEQEIEVLLQPRKDKFLVMTASSGGKSVTEVTSSEYWNDLETSHRERISEKRLKCVFTVNDGSTSATTSPKMTIDSTGTQGQENPTEKALIQANDRIKKLEILLAETKRSKGSGNLTSGIVPFELANQLNMLSPPQSMFPPILVAIIAIISFFIGWILWPSIIGHSIK